MSARQSAGRIPGELLTCLAVAFAALCACGFAATSPAKPGPSYAAVQKAYFAKFEGWEARPLTKARARSKLVFKSDLSAKAIEKDWKADGVAVQSKAGAAVLSLAPEAAAAGKRWGVLWAKSPFTFPLMIEVEFTLDPGGPHDANLVWGQKTPSKERLGKDQECYLAGFFGWGGRSCGIERASDWHVFGITSMCDPKPGVKRTGVWIIDRGIQCLYLDGKLAVYSKVKDAAPASGHFGLEIYQSRVTFHSVKIHQLGGKKK